MSTDNQKNAQTIYSSAPPELNKTSFNMAARVTKVILSSGGAKLYIV